MSKLYADLAEVYAAMYTTFINYKAEYDFYSKILKKYHKNTLLEIGSGTGNLAAYFKENGFNYCGLDLSEQMIAIAKRKALNCDFIQGDMRTFKLDKQVQSIIMAGRTISYLVSNEEVNTSFLNIHHNLDKGGIFCFDFIDANKFIPAILKEKTIVHQATHNNINYVRKAVWEPNLKYGMDVKWEAKYYKNTPKGLIPLGEDSSVVRTFSKDEITLFLSINHFEIKDIIERASYAFPTFVVVAEKK